MVDLLKRTYDIGVEAELLTSAQQKLGLDVQAYMLALAQKDVPVIKDGQTVEQRIKAINDLARQLATVDKTKDVIFNGVTIKPEEYNAATNLIQTGNIPEDKKQNIAFSATIADAAGFWPEHAKESVLFAQNGQRAKQASASIIDSIRTQGKLNGKELDHFNVEAQSRISKFESNIKKRSTSPDLATELQNRLDKASIEAEKMRMAKASGGEVTQDAVDALAEEFADVSNKSFEEAVKSADKIPDKKGEKLKTAIDAARTPTITTAKDSISKTAFKDLNEAAKAVREMRRTTRDLHNGIADDDEAAVSDGLGADHGFDFKKGKISTKEGKTISEAVDKKLQNIFDPKTGKLKDGVKIEHVNTAINDAKTAYSQSVKSALESDDSPKAPSPAPDARPLEEKTPKK